VRRDGQTKNIPASGLVVGDIVVLSTGNLIPANGILFSARDFPVTEAVLTGESMPVKKHPGVSAKDAPSISATTAPSQAPPRGAALPSCW
jgi:P-type Mg2+ transporter